MKRPIVLAIACGAWGCGLVLGVDWDRVAVMDGGEGASLVLAPDASENADGAKGVDDEVADGDVIDGGVADGSLEDVTDGSLVDTYQPPALLYDCNGTAVPDCAQCTNMPTGCIYCGFINATKLKGLCVPKDQLCYNQTVSGYDVCPCQAPDASTGPVVGQACRDYTPQYCTTCGDPNSGGSPCKGGGTCNATTGECN